MERPEPQHARAGEQTRDDLLKVTNRNTTMTSSETSNNSKPLDVDRFPSTLVIKPRNPVTYEMTLTPGKKQGELYLIGFEYELAKGKGAKNPDAYKAKPPQTQKPSQISETTAGEAALSTANVAPERRRPHLE
jgi:hypothetical protein